ncbi:MAG: hypothetical protein DCC58_15735 [Chloroflexi bacterium]|nr:MAG: hypothetical protein DCC58_15735 [Chloroflexota bacterium]
MTIAPVIKEHIAIVQGAGGPKAVIAGHRIRVIDIVVWHEKMGQSVDEILADFPQLTPGDVYAALAYYWDHRDEIEQRIADAERAYDEGRQQQSLLQDRIAARKARASQVPV